MSKYVILVLFFNFLFSCKKEIQKIPDSTDPIFYIHGTIGNESISIDIGKGEEIFLTKIDTINGVKFFNGILSTSEFDLKLGVFDGNIDFENIKIENIKSLSSLELYKEINPTLFHANKFNFPNHQLIEKIEWFVDNDFTSLNELKITLPGKYKVCSKIYFINGDVKNLCNDLILGYKKNSTCALEFNYTGSNNNLYTWINSEYSISSTIWKIDNEIVCQCPFMTTQIQKTDQLVETEIEFQNGAKRKRAVLIDGKYDQNSIIDFAKFENYSSIIYDYAAKLTFIKNGHFYCSSYADNTDKKVNVKNIVFVGKDDKMNSIYKLTGSVQANLFSKELNQTLPINLEFSWGIMLE